MTEIWAPVRGFEGVYEVSNLGNVKSLDRVGTYGRFWPGKIISQSTINSGYLIVSLYDCGREEKRLVHRMVAEAFIENPLDKGEVNHKNEIKTDNRVCNLEWATRRENANYGTRNERDAKTKRIPIVRICPDGAVEYYASATDAAKSLGICRSIIHKCCKGKSKPRSGDKFVYAEIYGKEARPGGDVLIVNGSMVPLTNAGAAYAGGGDMSG